MRPPTACGPPVTRLLRRGATADPRRGTRAGRRRGASSRASGHQVSGPPGRSDHLHPVGAAGQGHQVGTGVDLARRAGVGRARGELPAGGLGQREPGMPRRLTPLDRRQRQQRARRCEVAARVVEDLGGQHARGRAVALQRRDPGGALHQGVESAPRGPGASGPPRRKHHHAEVGMPLRQVRRVQPVPGQRTGPVALDQQPTVVRQNRDSGANRSTAWPTAGRSGHRSASPGPPRQTGHAAPTRPAPAAPPWSLRQPRCQASLAHPQERAAQTRRSLPGQTAPPRSRPTTPPACA